MDTTTLLIIILVVLVCLAVATTAGVVGGSCSDERPFTANRVICSLDCSCRPYHLHSVNPREMIGPMSLFGLIVVA